VALDAGNGHEIWRVQVGNNDLGYHMTGSPTVIDVAAGIDKGTATRALVRSRPPGDRKPPR
jgi:hypothetical protein